MKKIALFVFLGCLAIRLLTERDSFFVNDAVNFGETYQPSVVVKFTSICINVLIDMIFVYPISFVAYKVIKNSNSYKTLIVLLTSWTFYNVLIHIIKYFTSF